jgi:hypothetical protein
VRFRALLHPVKPDGLNLRGYWPGARFHGAGVVGIASKYALKDSRTKPARQAPLHVQAHRPGAGSATVYIAKIYYRIDGITQAANPVGLDYASGTTADKGAAGTHLGASAQHPAIPADHPSVTVWHPNCKVKD